MRPPSPVIADRDGQVYEYCSPSCRDGSATGDHEHAAIHGFKRFRPRVPVVDRQLPAGFLRNSLTLVSSAPGTRGDALLVELVWYTLQQGGAAVVACREPPISILEQFLSLEWNVIPYLDSGQLRIVDCFTCHVEDPGRLAGRLDRWSRHLHEATADASESVRDPSGLGSVRNALDGGIESGTVRGAGSSSSTR